MRRRKRAKARRRRKKRMSEFGWLGDSISVSIAKSSHKSELDEMLTLGSLINP